jgi:hypothetical protein
MIGCPVTLTHLFTSQPSRKPPPLPSLITHLHAPPIPPLFADGPLVSVEALWEEVGLGRQPVTRDPAIPRCVRHWLETALRHGDLRGTVLVPPTLRATAGPSSSPSPSPSPSPATAPAASGAATASASPPPAAARPRPTPDMSPLGLLGTAASLAPASPPSATVAVALPKLRAATSASLLLPLPLPLVPASPAQQVAGRGPAGPVVEVLSGGEAGSARATAGPASFLSPANLSWNDGHLHSEYRRRHVLSVTALDELYFAEESRRQVGARLHALALLQARFLSPSTVAHTHPFPHPLLFVGCRCSTRPPG